MAIDAEFEAGAREFVALIQAKPIVASLFKVDPALAELIKRENSFFLSLVKLEERGGK